MKFGRFEPWNELATAYEFHFGNGYGGIAIRGPQGLYELEVIKRNRLYPSYWDITFDTPITSDVLGNLEVGDVVKALEDISHLADVYEGGKQIE
jgi:hypothetical protein